ncbi:MAG: gamma-glutamyltransferase family protein [Paracoccaceae bacterium]|nr:gamma-glutamyltransferase family protein [Paracoccaceae bacterium]
MRDFHLPGRSPVFAANGLCATSHPLAASTAIKVLEQGGNAVDAAISAAVLLGFCEPQMTGIGGDCFVLLKPSGSEDIIALNGSGRAPAGLNAQALREQGHETIPADNVHAVTVPGAVDAFCRLSKDWGRLELAEVLAPAIRYAEEGVPVAPRVAFDWLNNAGHLSGDARKFYLKDGMSLKAGQSFQHPQQAEVLRRIAKEGREAFYTGEVADDMVQSLNALGGVHTLEDFAATACNYDDPISTIYHGTELVEQPPNGQGATAILLANILSHFDIASMDPFGAQRVHIEAEATKLAYDARYRFQADLDHMTRLDHMTAPETASALAALIRADQVIQNATRISEGVHKDTVYLTVVDRDLMAVSMICSVFHSFGTGLASSKFGINFHNRGCGFTLDEGHPNEAAGGKRPMHTIIPGMLRRDGKVLAPFGVMGGQYQANGHARFLSNMVDFGMDVQETIDAPRSFAEHMELRVERGYSESARQELADMGHKVVVPPAPLGGSQAIVIDRDNGVLVGGSDPRKDGAAIGY